MKLCGLLAGQLPDLHSRGRKEGDGAVFKLCSVEETLRREQCRGS